MPLLQSLRASAEPLIALNATQRAAKERVDAALAEGILNLVEVDCVSGAPRETATLVGERDRYGFPISTYLCPQTGLLWSSPVFDAASQALFYRDYYRELYFGAKQASDEFFANQQAEGKGILAYLRLRAPGLRPGRVLEIGCGAGGVLSAFRAEGWEVAGCDFGDDYLQRGRADGLDLRAGASDALFDLSGADLLIARHVLEHTLDPLAELQNWANLLSPDGVMFIEVPGTLRALDDYREAGRYFHIAHTYHFTLRSLQALAARAGLELIVGDERLVAVLRRSAPTESNSSGEAKRVQDYFVRWESPFMRLVQRLRRPLVRLRASVAKRLGGKL
ncbi:MAG: class I SAM-dependent methyltransferase [Chthonomonas sp.]|nr:class I SAM-dependent methyltransferase [Chthonomonas sp.]